MTDSPLSKYYSSIETLPLNLFWDICISDDKSLLVITGEPSDDELLEAWRNITMEYAELMSPETKKRIKSELRLAYSKYKASYVFSAIRLLKSAMPYKTTLEQEATLQSICDSITGFIPSVKLDYRKREALLSAFDRAEAFAKKWVIEINEKLDDNVKQVVSNVKAQRADFQNMLISVILFHKMPHISADKLTVQEFSLYWKRMNDQIEAQKANGGFRNN